MTLVFKRTVTITPELLDELAKRNIEIDAQATKIKASYNKRKKTIEISQIIPTDEKIVEFNLEDDPKILDVFEIKDIEYIIRPKKPEVKTTSPKNTRSKKSA